MLELGSEGRDRITGFTGILTARHTYITGCDQYSMTPNALNKEGDLKEGYQFDEGRIVIIGAGISVKEVQKDKKNPGGPQPSFKQVK